MSPLKIPEKNFQFKLINLHNDLLHFIKDHLVWDTKSHENIIEVFLKKFPEIFK